MPVDAEVARLFDLSGSELDRVLSAYDKVPEGTKRRVRELFSKEANATSQNKALASEARRLVETHRDEYPRLQPGEVLLAAAVLQQVDEEAGDLALVEIVRGFQLEPGMAAPPVASSPSTLSSTLLPRLRFFVLGLADLVMVLLRANESEKSCEAGRSWVHRSGETRKDDPLLPQVLEIRRTTLNAKGHRCCTQLLGSGARGCAGGSHSAHCSAILLALVACQHAAEKAMKAMMTLAIGRWNIQVRPPHDRYSQQCAATGLRSTRLRLCGTHPATRVLASKTSPGGAREPYFAYRH